MERHEDAQTARSGFSVRVPRVHRDQPSHLDRVSHPPFVGAVLRASDGCLVAPANVR
jgi:hypothetical protein